MNDYAKERLNSNKNLINENRNNVLADREMDAMEPRMLDAQDTNQARLDNSGRADMELDGGKRNTRRFRRNRRTRRNRRQSRRR